MHKSDVSFIVPSFNEALNLENTVSEIREGCAQATDRVGRVEIILINDGSDDGAAEIMERLKAANSDVHCIHHPINLGFGAAYKRGALEESMSTSCWLPAKIPYRPGPLARF